jgi:hypothetical protein
MLDPPLVATAILAGTAATDNSSSARAKTLDPPAPPRYAARQQPKVGTP